MLGDKATGSSVEKAEVATVKKAEVALIGQGKFADLEARERRERDSSPLGVAK